MPSTRSVASYNPSSSSQKGNRRDYGRTQSDKEGQGSVKNFHNSKLSNSEADEAILPSKRADTATRSLSRHLQSQPEGLQQCTSAQRVPDPFRSVEKLHELIPDGKKAPGSSQHLQVTQLMASIDGKKEYDAFKSRMEEKQPSITKSSGQKQQFQREKAATSSKQGQREGTTLKALQPGLQDAMENVLQMARTMMELQKKEGSQLKIPKMISDIFDSIPELYEAINDLKNIFLIKMKPFVTTLKQTTSFCAKLIKHLCVLKKKI
ncbi:hypothetical protein O181_125890 [Austropuccinia psidii MF-1]|uniref:Uncharacterized protein n=1 Tax=Austropuccinia psidii MF-1 TaxID=1389203 RepID=A0A9Q3Q6J7_9BASI|nr:hypothetical protein [Austropuccinia psidii MF-1]